jgi:hypothetical protein
MGFSLNKQFVPDDSEVSTLDIRSLSEEHRSVKPLGDGDIAIIGESLFSVWKPSSNVLVESSNPMYRLETKVPFEVHMRVVS